MKNRSIFLFLFWVSAMPIIRSTGPESSRLHYQQVSPGHLRGSWRLTGRISGLHQKQRGLRVPGNHDGKGLVLQGEARLIFNCSERPDKTLRLTVTKGPPVESILLDFPQTNSDSSPIPSSKVLER